MLCSLLNLEHIQKLMEENYLKYLSKGIVNIFLYFLLIRLIWIQFFFYQISYLIAVLKLYTPHCSV